MLGILLCAKVGGKYSSLLQQDRNTSVRWRPSLLNLPVQQLNTSQTHAQAVAGILTLPVPLPVGGSLCGQLCPIVGWGVGAASVTISDYMGRRAWLILRRPMLCPLSYRRLKWGEWRDLNPRSPGPQPGALDHQATLTTGSSDIIAKNPYSFNEW